MQKYFRKLQETFKNRSYVPARKGGILTPAGLLQEISLAARLFQRKGMKTHEGIGFKLRYRRWPQRLRPRCCGGLPAKTDRLRDG